MLSLAGLAHANLQFMQLSSIKKNSKHIIKTFHKCVTHNTHCNYLTNIFLKFKAENYDIIHCHVRKMGTPNCRGKAAGIGLGSVGLQLRLWSADRVTVSYSHRLG